MVCKFGSEGCGRLFGLLAFKKDRRIRTCSKGICHLRLALTICFLMAGSFAARAGDASATSNCVVSLIGSEISFKDHEGLNRVLVESGSIFDQGVKRLAATVNGRSYFLERNEDGVRVRADDPSSSRPEAYRVRDHLLQGGLSKRVVVMKKELKLWAAYHSVQEDESTIALRLSLKPHANNRRTGNVTMYALFRDEPTGKRDAKGDPIVRRKIFDLIYPRQYTISAKTRGKIRTDKNVELSDLDYAFEHRPERFEPDLYMNLAGEIIERPPPDPQLPRLIGRHEWFLCERDGKVLRVVTFQGDGAHLPEIQTAYYPKAKELNTLMAEIERNHLKADFQSEALPRE